MLEHQDYLSLIAELAVAMAGFTGIVAVFRFRGANPDDRSSVGFVTMLRASLSALLLSLLPFLLFAVLNNAELTWRIGNAAIVFVMTVNLYQFVIRGGVYNSTSIGKYILFPIAFMVLSANLLGIFGMLVPATVFIIAVSWQLVVSTHNFAQLILSDNEPFGFKTSRSGGREAERRRD